jgi:hypothetical protein
MSAIPKGGNEVNYEVRLNYSDGTFDVVTVSDPLVASHSEAVALALFENPGAESAIVLGVIDRQPQVCLAW